MTANTTSSGMESRSGQADSQASARADTDRPSAGTGSSEIATAGVHMPRDFSVSLRTRGPIDVQLADGDRRRRHSMNGFEDTYVDIVDYIVRITHRIWENKDIGYIYDTYSHNANVHDDHGLQIGRDKIVADTIHTINAFPDIRLFADEIVWAGDDEVGFRTSHRVSIIGTNTGYSRYGPPTGRRVVTRSIANCVAKNNEIFDEWVIYDVASMLQQLGHDLRALAADSDPTELDSLQDASFGSPERLPGQATPPVLQFATGDFDVDDFIRVAYHNIWNRRMLGTIKTVYTPDVRYHGSTNRELYGRAELESFVLSMLAMLPDLALQVDEVYWMGNDDDGYRTSVRWSLRGTHTGNGVYGRPTGRPVSMWGISQHDIGGGVITEETTLFNEMDVMRQIYGGRADEFANAKDPGTELA